MTPADEALRKRRLPGESQQGEAAPTPAGQAADAAVDVASAETTSATLEASAQAGVAASAEGAEAQRVALADTAGGEMVGGMSAAGGTSSAAGAMAAPAAAGVLSTPAMVGLGGLLVAGLAAASGGGGGGSKGTDVVVKPPVDQPTEPPVDQPAEPQDPGAQTPGTDGGETPSEPGTSTQPGTSTDTDTGTGTDSGTGAGTDTGTGTGTDAGTGTTPTPPVDGGQTPTDPITGTDPNPPAAGGDGDGASTPPDVVAPPPEAPILHFRQTGTGADGEALSNSREVWAENFAGDYLKVVFEAPDGSILEKTSRNKSVWMTDGDGDYKIISAEFGFDDPGRQGSGTVGGAGSPLLTFSLDTTPPPEIYIIPSRDEAGGSNDVFFGSSPNSWLLRGLDAGSVWRYQVNDGEWHDGVGSEVDIANMPQETFRLNLQQEDLAGNVAQSSFVFAAFERLTGDSELPRVVIQDSGAHDLEISTNSKYLAYRGSVDIDDSFGSGAIITSARGLWAADNGGEFSSVRAVAVSGNSFTFGRVAGGYVVSESSLIDESGGELKFTFDNAAPVQVQLAVGDAEDIQVLNVEDKASWRYQLDGSDWFTGTGTTIDVSHLGSGMHTAHVVQEDRAGNVSQVAELIFDNTLPLTASLLSNTDGAVI